jgi:Tfp pilus assembly protein PilF
MLERILGKDSLTERAGIRAYLVSVLLIILVTFAVYANSVSGEFVIDDIAQIKNNKQITSFVYLPKYFRGGILEGIIQYRPLFLVTLLLEYKIWGLKPYGYHLTNIFLHACNSLFVFFLIKKLLKGKEVVFPAMGAMLFAVHPVHTESVSWISGVTDLILSAFFLSAFLFYLEYRKTQKKQYFSLCLIFFTFSVFSKEVAVMFPLIVILYDYIYEKKTYLYSAGSLFLVVLIFIVLRKLALGEDSALRINLSVPLDIPVMFLASYVRLMFIPWPLDFYLSPPENVTFGKPWEFVFLAAVIVAMIIGSFRNPLLKFSLFWFFLILLPVLFLPFYHVPIFAVRFLYLPSVAFSIIAVVLAGKIQEKFRNIVVVLLALIIIACSVITVRANMDWLNEERLSFKILKVTPSYASAYRSLGRYYLDKGRPDKAIDALVNGLENVREQDRKSFYEGLGFLYSTTEDYEKSIFYYQEALKMDPEDTELLINLGNAHASKDELGRAVQYYSKAFDVDRENMRACYNLGLAHELMEDEEKAAYYYNIFLEKALFGFETQVYHARKYLHELSLQSR